MRLIIMVAVFGATALLGIIISQAEERGSRLRAALGIAMGAGLMLPMLYAVLTTS